MVQVVYKPLQAKISHLILGGIRQLWATDSHECLPEHSRDKQKYVCKFGYLMLFSHGIHFRKKLWLNSSLVMSLGTDAWRVSGWPDATSREEVSMATVEVGTTPKAATNRHCHTQKISVEILTHEIPTWKLLKKPPATRQGGRRGSENPQRFTKKKQLIRYNQQAKQQCNITLATIPPKRPCNSPKGRPACLVEQ